MVSCRPAATAFGRSICGKASRRLGGRSSMRRLSIAATALLLAALPVAVAVAADLTGKWTTDGRYAFRNTASGTLTETTLTISGARERTGERAYRAELERVVPPP